MTDSNHGTPELLNSASLNQGQTLPSDYPRFLFGGPGRYSDAGGFFEARDDSHTNLRDYLEIMRRRKWTLALVFFGILLVTILVTVFSTPIYRSEATLEVEKESGSSLNNIGDEITQGMGVREDELFATQVGILKGRTLAEALLDKMRLGESKEFASKGGVLTFIMGWVLAPVNLLSGSQGTDGMPDENAARNVLVGQIRDRVSAKRDGKGRLLEVGIEAKDPRFGQAMLHNYVDLYLNQNLNKRRRVSLEAGVWLREELKEAEKKAIASLAAVIDFTSKHGLVSLEDENNHILKFFNKTAEGLVQSKQNRLALEALQQSSGKGLTVFPAEVKPPDTEGLHTKLSMLESEYAQMAEIYSENYPKAILLRKQINFLKERIGDLQKGVVKAIVETAKVQEKMHEEAFESAKRDALQTASLGTQYAILKKGADTNEEIFKILLRKSKELQVGTQIIGNNIITVTPPTLPSMPIRPRVVLNLIIGCALGLIVGILAVFIQERLDSSVQTPEEGESVNLPSLGFVPGRKYLSKETNSRDFEGPVELYAYYYPASSISEAIKNVKTSLAVSFTSSPCASVMVTSALPGEGKTFLSTALGTLFSSPDKRVLLMEADLRRPRINAIFGHPKGPGLSALLNGNGTAIEEVVRSTPIPGFYYISAGEIPLNPVNLLESLRLREWIAKLTEEFDFVLVDCPPVIGFSDARLLAAVVDGIILVVKQGSTPLDLVRRAGTLLTLPKGGRVLGHVLNGVAPSFSHYSHYGYSKKYSYYLPKYTHR